MMERVEGLAKGGKGKAALLDTAAGSLGGAAASLRGLTYAEQQAQTRPAPAEAEAPEAAAGIASAVFAGIPVLEDVMAGGALIRKDSPYTGAVRALQTALSALGFDCGTADGLFGPLTGGGVRKFQAASGLSTDGIVGPVTLGVLDQEAVGIGADNVTDTRLGHNTIEVNGKELDPERGSGIFEPMLPFQEGGGWDHSTILAYWSQQDNDPDITTTDAVRCQVNASMAVRITAGPQALIDWATAAQAEAVRLMNDPTTNQIQANNIKLTLSRLAFPIAELDASIRIFQNPAFGDFPRAPLASYRTLDTIADAVKIMLTVNPHSVAGIGASDHGAPNPESENIFTLKTGSSRESLSFPLQVGSRLAMAVFLGLLRPGEAYLVAVDLHQGSPKPGGPHKVSELDHGITVGREPLDKGGRFYLYDPAPKEGDQIVYLKDLGGAEEEKKFWPYFEVDPKLTGGVSVFKNTLVLEATQVVW